MYIVCRPPIASTEPVGSGIGSTAMRISTITDTTSQMTAIRKPCRMWNFLLLFSHPAVRDRPSHDRLCQRDQATHVSKLAHRSTVAVQPVAAGHDALPAEDARSIRCSEGELHRLERRIAAGRNPFHRHTHAEVRNREGVGGEIRAHDLYRLPVHKLLTTDRPLDQGKKRVAQRSTAIEVADNHRHQRVTR